jgi:glucose/arabinose dehydrogenase
MKRLIWAAVGFGLLMVIIWAGMFYWRHLRGAAPAFTGPPQDIAKLMEEAGGGKTPASQTRNTTGYPLKLPPGFSISIFAKNLGGPRVLALDASGNLLASIPSQGRIVALPDADRDGRADKIIPVVSDLNRPHGFAFHPKDSQNLYIAEVEHLAVYDYDSHQMKATSKRKIAALPSGDGRHWTRTLLFTPDAQRLLVSVGSSCDTCVEKDPRHGTIQVVDAGGGDLEPFATGLRNAVFMTRHPVTGQVWVTEMGRDFLGDDLPPDEINIVEEGKDYGWPWCYGKQVHDGNFDPTGKKKVFCKETVPSYIDIPAHSAPLGLAFIPATPDWPQEYHHNLLAAYAQAHRHTQKNPHHRLRAHHHFPGLRVRLLRHPGLQGPPGRGL